MASWVVIPPLFVFSSAGVTAVFEFLLRQRFVNYVTLSMPALLGVAAAIAVLSSGDVRWRYRWQQRWLRFGYPLLLMACALSMDDLRLPSLVLVAGGIAAGAGLSAVVLRSRADCSRRL